MSHGEPVKSELFCVKKRWQKKEASSPEVLLSVNANLVSLLSGADRVRGPNRAKSREGLSFLPKKRSRWPKVSGCAHP